MDKNVLLVGIDPGSEWSGVCVAGGSLGLQGHYVPNAEVFGLVRRLAGSGRVVVVMEDLRAYRGAMRGALLITAKWMGQWEWRFGVERFVAEVHLIPRNTVKAWLFRECPEVCIPRIQVRIDSLGPVVDLDKQHEPGRPRRVSFHYVDDRIVIAAVKSLCGIPTPKPGHANIFGLTAHSYQALAVALCWMYS